jgi:hypothetical protein
MGSKHCILNQVYRIWIGRACTYTHDMDPHQSVPRPIERYTMFTRKDSHAKKHDNETYSLFFKMEDTPSLCIEKMHT